MCEYVYAYKKMKASVNNKKLPRASLKAVQNGEIIHLKMGKNRIVIQRKHTHESNLY